MYLYTRKDTGYGIGTFIYYRRVLVGSCIEHFIQEKQILFQRMKNMFLVHWFISSSVRS